MLIGKVRQEAQYSAVHTFWGRAVEFFMILKPDAKRVGQALHIKHIVFCGKSLSFCRKYGHMQRWIKHKLRRPISGVLCNHYIGSLASHGVPRLGGK
jgi:hypothetical protein